MQAISKVTAELRGKPWRSLELPLALPVFASAVVLQAIGALAGLIAPQRFLDAVPDELPGEHVRTPAGAHRGPFASSEGRLQLLDSRPKP